MPFQVGATIRLVGLEPTWLMKFGLEGRILLFSLKTHDFPLFLLLQAQYGQALQILGEANQHPFTRDFLQAAQGELAKARD